MYDKVKIYNLTLSNLLLAKVVTEVETDTSNEVKVLNSYYDIALEATLKDLDLDGLSSELRLELIVEQEEDKFWRYVYKYPDNCAYLRRLVSCVLTDNRRTHLPKRVGMYTGGLHPVKAIYTNEYNAIAEVITNNFPLNALSSNAGMTLAYKLAYMSAPLITGKGAKALREELMRSYVMSKAEAQEDDKAENFNYEEDYTRSEYVDARLE